MCDKLTMQCGRNGYGGGVAPHEKGVQDSSNSNGVDKAIEANQPHPIQFKLKPRDE